MSLSSIAGPTLSLQCKLELWPMIACLPTPEVQSETDIASESDCGCGVLRQDKSTFKVSQALARAACCSTWYSMRILEVPN